VTRRELKILVSLASCLYSQLENVTSQITFLMLFNLLFADLPGEKEIFDGSSLSPNRSGQPNRSRLFSKEEIGLSPVPQVEEQFLFRIDSHCSPIPGIPDDEGLLQHSAPRSRRSLPSSPCEMEVDGQKSKVVTRARKNRPPLIPASSPRRRPGSADVERRNDTENDESSRLSLSQESEDSTSTTGSSKARRLRPMPDMSAFEAGTSLRSASTVNTTGDSSPSASEKRTVASSPKLVCPPTPVRTPAWAHPTNGAKPVFERSNSLIATKVLATCPVNVLDGHSSLENSLLDDDENEPYAPGFPTVEEVPENTSDLPDTVMEDVPPKTRLTRHSSLPLNNVPPPPPLVARTSCSPRTLMAATSRESSGLSPKTPGQMKAGATRLSGSFGEVGSIIAFARDFENLGKLGSGAFADVFKVRSRLDGQLYAVKRNRRQFRGKRDREMALAEVRIMQQLQSVCAQTSAASAHGGKAKTKTVHSLYVLFFFQAWQEEGYFFCQTELCCRDTCRELIQSLRGDWPVASQKYPSLRRNLESPDVDMIDGTDTESNGRLMPEMSIWKICHDVAAGLSHVHAHRIVHYDIKLSNIFFISHSRLGAMCKIGDFGMAGQVGSSEDGQEGDTMYMAPELLQSGIKHASADIFSLGLSLYELASAVTWELPSEGPRWLELRSGSHVPELPPSRSKELSCLIQSMIHPEAEFRPTADDILDKVDKVKELGSKCDPFLRDYVKDVEEYDRGEEQRLAIEQMEADERGQTPRNASTSKRLWRLDSSSGPSSSDEPPVPMAPVLFSPQAADTRSK
jgi:serine/threonine protein kinase